MITVGRKRPVGTPLPVSGGRRQPRGRWSTTAGVQGRRTSTAPLITHELEPGQIIRRFCTEPHPFNVKPNLEEASSRCVSFLALPDSEIVHAREKVYSFWLGRALALRSQSLGELRSVGDPGLRAYHLRDCGDASDPPLGTFCHIALWREMCAAVKCPDLLFIDSMLNGFPLFGEVQRSSTWEAITEPAPPMYDQAELERRAWGLRTKVQEKLERSKGGPFAEAVWEATIEDIRCGFASGPYFTVREVDEEVGAQHWLPMPRFGIQQGGKVRPIDDASASGSSANLWTSLAEKLSVPTLDEIISLVRAVKRAVGDSDVGAWIVDESKAFRQVPVLPADRKMSVIAVYSPTEQKVGYAVMRGHPFGLTPSVYNFNRRAGVLTQIVLQLFSILARNYYDDRFGVSKRTLVEGEAALVVKICTLLGVSTNHKTRWGAEVGLLGIQYNFREGRLHLLETRRFALTEEILLILKRNKLTPGEASKLKGKLVFVSSHRSGKHGRPFMLALSERQYSRRGDSELSEALRRALRMWLLIINTPSQARPLYGAYDDSPPDVLLFTDGSVPDPRSWKTEDQEPPRVGWCAFFRATARRQERVVFSSFTVPAWIMQEWLPRQTQIVMVELFAAVLAVEALSTDLIGCKVLLFIDSQPAEAAIIRGYSSRGDMNDLVAYFWDIVLERDLVVYTTHVPSDGNLADGPSRAEFEQLVARGAVWCTSTPSAMLSCSAQWRESVDQRLGYIEDKWNTAVKAEHAVSTT